MKESLEGKRFGSSEWVEEHERNGLTTRPQTFYDQGIWKLPHGCQKSVNHAGDYTEKCQIK